MYPLRGYTPQICQTNPPQIWFHQGHYSLGHWFRLVHFDGHAERNPPGGLGRNGVLKDLEVDNQNPMILDTFFVSIYSPIVGFCFMFPLPSFFLGFFKLGEGSSRLWLWLHRDPPWFQDRWRATHSRFCLGKKIVASKTKRHPFWRVALPTCTTCI